MVMILNQILILDEESNVWKSKEKEDKDQADNNDYNDNIFKPRFGHAMSEVDLSEFWQYCQNSEVLRNSFRSTTEVPQKSTVPCNNCAEISINP